MTESDLWDEAAAQRYDEESAEMFAPEVLDPAVDTLARLADGGPALELAIGTGRVAIPLADRGIAVSGIELSAPMVARLHAKRPDIPVTIGDTATADAPAGGPGEGGFSLAFVVWNSLGNVRTQDGQVATFANAARHLRPGGHFVVELWVPAIRRFPPGAAGAPFDVSEEHTGIDTYDLGTQQGTSHHYTREAYGSTRYGQTNFRYCWPAELDLMARLAGLEPVSRHADWSGTPFVGDSTDHVSVWRKPLVGQVAVV